MHSECSHQKVRDVVMSQQHWEAWPATGSPDPVADSASVVTPDQEVAPSFSTEECCKQIQLPKQLEAVRKAIEFPFERHRWNTNEEVAAILIAFDTHESWEKQEVKTRPPSGSMLLYSRKKVRYRKDGYCWKKRKDGKTTREDHMKLKVQGIECIYGSYVHSAILPTFHRRCYWLLQNPDLVLVHYLNVPLTDDNKICLPPILQVDCKEWNYEDLVSQLRPMFASVKHYEMAGSSSNESTEDVIESLVKHILGKTTADPISSTPVQLGASVVPRTVAEILRSVPDSKLTDSSGANTMHSRLLQLICSHKMSSASTSFSDQHQVADGQLGLAICESINGATMLRGMKSTSPMSSVHKVVPHHGPLILNVSPLPGSKGLLILSSQASQQGIPMPVFNQTLTGTLGSVDVMMSKEAEPESIFQGSYKHMTKKNFRPVFSGFGSEGARAHSEPATNEKSPCYDVSDFLNHDNILGGFDLPQVVKSEVKENDNDRSVPPFSKNPTWRDFSNESCVTQQDATAVRETQELNHIGMESMEFLFGDSPLVSHEQSSLLDEHTVKCEFYNFQGTSAMTIADRGSVAETRVTTNNSVDPRCIADNMDTSLVGNQKDLDDMKTLSGDDLIMDELEDILHIVSETLSPSVDLINSFSLSSDSSATAMSGLYQCSSVSGAAKVLAMDEKLKTVQSDNLSTNEQFYCHGNSKAGLVEITDYCPEWSYTEGGTKVLVTGPWQQLASSSYSVMFDDLNVPTSMVQGGVLRCFAPAHSPAVVCLRVACNGQVVSEPKVFEYKSRDQMQMGNETDWFLVQERQLKDLLVQRFEEVEKSLMDEQMSSLSSSSLSQEVTESSLIRLVDQLIQHTWPLQCSLPPHSLSQMTLLHLSAALGYSRLISALIKWRTHSHSLVLEHDIDSLSIDAKGNTPVMWACARGHYDALAVLSHWSPSSLQCPNKCGWRPANILQHFGNKSLVEVLQQMGTSSLRTDLHSQTLHRDENLYQLTPPRENFDLSSSVTLTHGKAHRMSSEVEPFFSECLSRTPSLAGDTMALVKEDWSSKDKTEDEDEPQPHSSAAHSDASESSPCVPPALFGAAKSLNVLKRTRLMKRTSVDILPDYPQFCSNQSKLSHTRTSLNEGNSFEGYQFSAVENQHGFMMGLLRTSNSDPHLTNLVRTCSGGGDPMISRIDRDLNSPVLFLQSSTSFDEDKGLSLEDVQRETVAMDLDSPDNIEGLSHEDGSEMLQSASDEADDDFSHSNQMMTLASQIIAAMPERIKISPSHSKHLLMDEINSRRDRTSSYSSFSSCSSSTPPVCITEDSGISTPLEGMSFLEYRYADIGTPTSTLSPTSTCLQSPYSFGLDSPPPTTAEFTEYFNAPATYMEKDFSQLTLSDEEQRRLYEAAKIIQNFYRKYKDKKEQQMRQQQKEIEAAILIQSYYRRYKQFMYYKRMTQAAVLIQSQFRSYYAQKCFKRSREAATIIQNRYRAYKEHERYKKSRNAAVIIQQRFRSHYQRTLAGRQSTLANTVHKMMADNEVSSDTDAPQLEDIVDIKRSRSSSEQKEITSVAAKDKIADAVLDAAGETFGSCCRKAEEFPKTEM